MTQYQKHRRAAITAVETLVSLTLLTTVIGVTAPMLVRHSRLLADERAYRQAVDELSNDLDRLTSLSGDGLRAAIDHLSTANTPGARLSGSVHPDDIGERIVLTIDWVGEVRRRPSITLVDWSLGKTVEGIRGGTP